MVADGRQIAFDCNATGKWNVYIVSSHGGKPVRFTQGPRSSIRPSWSHDGKSIYYCASGENGPQIWKKTTAGGSSEIQLTKNGGCNQAESPDGAYVYYLKPDLRALWRVPTAGGQEIEVLTSAQEMQFALGKQGTYFVEIAAPATLKYLDSATRTVKVLGVLPGPVSSQGGVSVSPDEHWFLYGKEERAGSQLMLVERFR